MKQTLITPISCGFWWRFVLFLFYQMRNLLESKVVLISSEEDSRACFIFKELNYSCTLSQLLGFAQEVKRLLCSYHEGTVNVALIFGVHWFQL